MTQTSIAPSAVPSVASLASRPSVIKVEEAACVITFFGEEPSTTGWYPGETEPVAELHLLLTTPLGWDGEGRIEPTQVAEALRVHGVLLEHWRDEESGFEDDRRYFWAEGDICLEPRIVPTWYGVEDLVGTARPDQTWAELAATSAEGVVQAWLVHGSVWAERRAAEGGGGIFALGPCPTDTIMADAAARVAGAAVTGPASTGPAQPA